MIGGAGRKGAQKAGKCNWNTMFHFGTVLPKIQSCWVSAGFFSALGIKLLFVLS